MNELLGHPVQLVKVTVKWMCIKFKRKREKNILFGTLEKGDCAW